MEDGSSHDHRDGGYMLQPRRWIYSTTKLSEGKFELVHHAHVGFSIDADQRAARP